MMSNPRNMNQPPDDIFKHIITFSTDQESARYLCTNKLIKKALNKSLLKTKQNAADDLKQKSDAYIAQCDDQKDKNHFHHFIHSIFIHKTMGCLRNIILKHASELNPDLFQKTFVDPFKIIDAPNDSYIKDDKAWIRMSGLSLSQITVLAEIYNRHYPTLCTIATRLGVFEDSRGNIIDETCVLSFNATIFIKHILPIIKGFEPLEKKTPQISL